MLPLTEEKSRILPNLGRRCDDPLSPLVASAVYIKALIKPAGQAEILFRMQASG
jgi:hypothetical protein